MTRNVTPLTGVWTSNGHEPWHVEPPRPIPEPSKPPLPVVVIGSALFVAALVGTAIGWAAVRIHEHLTAGRP